MDDCQLDEGWAAGCEVVAAGGDTPTRSIVLKKSLDDIARAIQLLSCLFYFASAFGA
jgi:hypothetical protein